MGHSHPAWLQRFDGFSGEEKKYHLDIKVIFLTKQQDLQTASKNKASDRFLFFFSKVAGYLW